MVRKRPGKAKATILNLATKSLKNITKNALAVKVNKKTFCFNRYSNYTCYMKFNKILQVLENDERSKAWLARKIKVSPSLLTLMLQGKRTFQETYKNRICSVLKQEYSELF